MIPMWATRLPWREIRQAADYHNLSPFLVAAMVMTESGGNTFSTRYEPGYKWVTPNATEHARRLGITIETEHFMQMTSWGLCQVMGATARDLGFTGNIVELVNPSLGLEYGCLYLKSKLQHGVPTEAALAAYNAGSARKNKDGTFQNQNYVDKVIKYIKELEGD